jgi:excinuclease UvrABC nuclease subunit
MGTESAVYAFTHRAVIDKAPNAPGVYSIFTSKRWVYVGESDDIRQSLFTHLNEPSRCLQRFDPLSFSFEVMPVNERRAALGTLLAARTPACALKE